MRKTGLFLWLLLWAILPGGIWASAYLIKGEFPYKLTCLSPEAFPELPGEIRSYLKAHGYEIVQSPLGKEIGRPKNNVVKGRFHDKNYYDWAVLAWQKKRACILIFKNGHCSTVDKWSADVFPRGILSVSKPDYVELVYKERVKSKDCPPFASRFDHDGLELMTTHTSAYVFYFHKGQWHKLYAGC